MININSILRSIVGTCFGSSHSNEAPRNEAPPSIANSTPIEITHATIPALVSPFKHAGQTTFMKMTKEDLEIQDFSRVGYSMKNGELYDRFKKLLDLDIFPQGTPLDVKITTGTPACSQRANCQKTFCLEVTYEKNRITLTHVM